MKKIFAFLFASALLATGLISCGGAGDESSRDVVTASQFLNGKGMTFLGGSPAWSILPNAYKNIGDVQRDETGKKYDTSTLITLESVPLDSEFVQEGRRVYQERYISFQGASSGLCSVDYLYSKDNTAIMTLSIGDNISSSSAAINAFGFSQALDDIVQDSFTISSIGGCSIVIWIDWAAHTATAKITASTTLNITTTVDQDGNVETTKDYETSFERHYTVVAVSQ